MMILGEDLFLLRSTDAFPEICRRLRRNIQPSFFELVALRIFFDGGFKIGAREEIGVRGEDFDFFGIRNGERVNAEVTALTEKLFSVKNAISALKHKRGQLPPNFASIIFCVLPESWMYPPQFVKPRQQHIAEEFLRGTRRINAVAFQAETAMSWSGASGSGTVPMLQNNFFNKTPRHPIRDMGTSKNTPGQTRANQIRFYGGKI